MSRRSPAHRAGDPRAAGGRSGVAVRTRCGRRSPSRSSRRSPAALAKVPADRFQTAAEFAHALTAQTAPTRSHPLPRQPPPPPQRDAALTLSRRGAGAAWRAVAVVADAGAGRTTGARSIRVSSPSPLSTCSIPTLGLWREGLVDLLARNLDGAGPLRTVSPTVVVRRWRGRPIEPRPRPWRGASARLGPVRHVGGDGPGFCAAHGQRARRRCATR